MDYEQFKEGFREDLKAALQARGIAADLRENHVEKLNQSYDALSVTPEGSNIGVNLNLGSIFEAHDAGLSYKEALDRAVSQVEAGIQQIPALHAADIVNYDEMKNKLSMEVVSAERNADLLQKIPHEQMEDMAVVYRLILGETPGGHNTLLVTNDLMEQFGINREQLHADAMVNAPEIRPSEIRGMTEVMNEMFGGMMPEMDPADEQLFVASVPSNEHGAGVIAYPNFFEDAAEKLGGDFYVLPSSIHEVLLVRDNGEMSVNDLEDMVRSVNASEVRPEEQLTDHVYHYDAKEHVFELAEKYEERRAERENEKENHAPELGTDAANEKSSDIRESLLDDLKSRKEEVAKEAPGKHARDAVKKTRGGEAL